MSTMNASLETGPLSSSKLRLLEKYLRGDIGPGSAHPEATILRRNLTGPVPLSRAQRQVWLHAQMVPELPLYNEPVAIHLNFPVHVPSLERSLNEIVRRHQAWRTNFTALDGEPVQIVHPPFDLNLDVVDLRMFPNECRQAEAVRIATEEARAPFDLANGPLLRAQLIQLDNEQYRLSLTLCHVIFDGVAIDRVLLPELTTLYEAFSSGQPSPLPELPFQYTDFAQWQRESENPEAMAEHLAYWKEQLRGELPEIQLPLDHVPLFARAFYLFRECVTTL
jgi:hypothetical protein